MELCLVLERGSWLGRMRLLRLGGLGRDGRRLLGLFRRRLRRFVRLWIRLVGLHFSFLVERRSVDVFGGVV